MHYFGAYIKLFVPKLCETHFITLKYKKMKVCQLQKLRITAI